MDDLKRWISIIDFGMKDERKVVNKLKEVMDDEKNFEFFKQRYGHLKNHIKHLSGDLKDRLEKEDFEGAYGILKDMNFFFNSLKDTVAGIEAFIEKYGEKEG